MVGFQVSHPLLGTTILQKQAENFLETTSGNAYWKNRKGVYQAVNPTFLKTSVMQSSSDIIGKSDLDLFWKDQAFILMSNDQEVINKRFSKILIEPVKSFQGTINHYLSHKMPLQNSVGKIIGSFGVSYLVDDINSVAIALNEINSFFNKSIVHYRNINKDILTARQKECLFYLVRGMTMKQIAKSMQLSPKTIEHYLDAIKIKLKCKTRQELVERALQLSYIKAELR